MPFGLSWQASGVVVRYWGRVTLDDVLECHRRIAGDSRFDDLRSALVETLAVESIALGPVEIEQIDAFLKGPAWTNPNITAVFVATHPELIRALALYDAIADHSYTTVVCPSVEAAHAVLAGRPARAPR